MFSQHGGFPSRTPLAKRTNAARRNATGARAAASSQKKKTTESSVTKMDKENNTAIRRKTSHKQKSSIWSQVNSHASPAGHLSTSTSVSHRAPPRVPTPSTTPRSLLSSEMKLANSSVPGSSAASNNSAVHPTTDDEDEEPLLCSPAPRQLTRRNKKQQQATPHRAPTTQTPKETKLRTTRSILKGNLIGKEQPKSTARGGSTVQRVTFMKNQIPKQVLSQMKPTTTNRASDTSPVRSKLSLSISTTRGDVQTNKQQPLASTKSEWSRHHMGFFHSSPFTPAVPKLSHSNMKKGVCMDLSDMFCNVASTTRHPPLARTRATPAPSKTTTSSNSCAPANDEWSEKQCDAVAKWLNYTFHPNNNNTESTSSSALCTLLLHQRLAQARVQGLQLFSSDSMTHIRNVILAEIGRGRIAVRHDRDMYADLTMRRQVIDLLFSYSVPWLRLGLETLFGGMPITLSQAAPSMTPGKAPTSQSRLMLKKFVIERVLSDEKLLAKYTGGLCKVPSGAFERKYRAELRSLVLYRLLTLFFFLDRVKQTENALDLVAPQLFQTNASVKSTRCVLLAFCRDFLSGEGDFVKHLARVGLSVSYLQKPVDELDFTVTNLAVDLRDGVRLGRLTEIVAKLPRNAILNKLRLPAVSRLQKLHNVNLVLGHLQNYGVAIPTDVLAHHLVDGHRERVLKLMWSVVAHFCLRDLCSTRHVQEETERIRTMGVRARFASLRSSISNDTITRKDEYDESVVKSLLVDWADAVCNTFGLAVRDLSTSFANGHAFCYLIHYYHPNLLRVNEIQKQSSISACTANCKLANQRLSDLGGIPEMVPVGETIPDEKSVLLCLAFLCSRLLESDAEVRACVVIQNWYRHEREQRLQKQKFAAARFLLHAWRRHRGSYFASVAKKYGRAVATIEVFVSRNRNGLQRLRALRLVRESRNKAAVSVQKMIRGYSARMRYYQKLLCYLSAIRLQSWFRMVHARRSYDMHLQLHFCATVIQRSWRTSYMVAYHKWEASKRIQCFWRRFHRQKVLRDLAATNIQRVWRGFLSQLKVEIDILDIITVQSCARRLLALRKTELRLAALSTLQRFARESLLCIRIKQKEEERRRRARKEFNAKLRRFQASRQRRFEHQCATSIQTAWISFVSQRLEMDRHSKVVVCQSAVRRWLAKRIVDRKMRSVLSVQASARQWLARRLVGILSSKRSMARKERASILLQAVVRAFVCRRSYQRLQCCRTESAYRIQSFWKMRIARFELKSSIAAAVRVQAQFRSSFARGKTETMKRAAVTIQTFARRYLSALMLKELRKARKETHYKMILAAVSIQRIFRGYVVRRELTMLNLYATRIQKVFHGFVTRIYFELDMMDIELVQSLARRWLAIRSSGEKLRCILRIQACCRSFLASKRLNEMMSFVVRLQSHVRMMTVLRAKRRLLQQVRLLQSFSRGWLTRRKKERYLCSVVKVQSLFRAARAREMAHKCRLAKADTTCKEDAALTIQYAWTCFIAKKDIEKDYAACLIQKTWRCYTVHVDFLLTINGALAIQQAWRSSIAREREKCQRAACTIQKTWRCFTVHIDFMLSILAAVRLQSVARRYLAREHFTKKENAILAIQSFARSSSRTRSNKPSLAVCRKGFVGLQSLFRGVRLRYKATPSLQRRLVRIRSANARALAEPRLRLYVKTQSALQVLRKSRSLSEIMNAVSVLEISTRLSERCCASFVDAEAPEILFALIRTCNRSLPHVELLQGVLLTLTNVAQYDELLPSISTINGLEVLLDLVQMFRDKEAVFCLSVSLLETVVRASDDFQERCRSHENLKRLKGVLALCVRKLSNSPAVQPDWMRKSIAHTSRQSLFPHCGGGAKRKKQARSRDEEPSLRHGSRTLRRVILLLDQNYAREGRN